MSNESDGSELAPDVSFHYGTAVFAVDLFPPVADSLFCDVLHAGVVPNVTSIQDLRLALYNYATGPGQPLAMRLMALFSTNFFADFRDYAKRLLIPGAASDNFDVVLLAAFAQVNLIVFKRSSTSSGLAVFNSRQFLSQEFGPQNVPDVPAAPELYLFQRTTANGLKHFLYLRREVDTNAGGARRATSSDKAAASRIAQTQPIPARVVNEVALSKNAPQKTHPTVDDSLQRLAKLGRPPLPVAKRPTLEFNVERGSDFRLLVGPRSFFVHKTALADHCGTFREFFRSPVFAQCVLNRKWDGRDIVVQLPDFVDDVPDEAFGAFDDDPVVAFQQFLELIYDCRPIAQIATPNLTRVVIIADKLRSDLILRRCDLELAKRVTQVRPAILAFSQRYQLAQLRKAQLALLDARVVDSFHLIGQLAEQDLSDYLEKATTQPPVKMLTVALIYLCGLDASNQIRKRGDFYEIGSRLELCRQWVASCAKKCRNTTDLADLYALVRKIRLVHYDGRYDDVALRDVVMLSLTAPKA